MSWAQGVTCGSSYKICGLRSWFPLSAEIGTPFENILEGRGGALDISPIEVEID